MTVPFISADDLSAYLETTVVDTDLLVLIALDSACQLVRGELRRQVNYEAADEVTLDGNGTTGLLLPERPVTEVTSVEVDGVALTTADYTVNADAGILWRTIGRWTEGHGNIAVTYSHGHALDEGTVTDDISRVPSNVRLVALELAAAIWRSAGPTVTGPITGETIGTSYSYTMDADVIRDFAATLLTEDMRQALGAEASPVGP